eukprot:gene15298-16875_t
MKPLRCIAAMDAGRGIGKDNKLPFGLRNEMRYFERITSTVSDPERQNVVLMGRKTWESIPVKHKPLKNRINIVLSTKLSTVPDGVIVMPNLQEAITAMNNSPLAERIESIFVGGGGGVYKDVIESEYCDRIYLTHIMKDFSCDIFFPEFDETVYKRTSDPSVPEGIQEENGIQYEFRLYQRQLKE